ncbi:protein kinase [Chitinimonas sp. BJYL2]|uniref:serine/threonine protein kinase n=1 Tax=Chitinimonas sp. BJYL2 TaxID=2976696 RepID=UPI0022B53996|nr:protein kinase [Chitinimonas sp. BJYL2]
MQVDDLITISQTIKSANSVYYRVIQALGNGGNSLVFLVEATSGEHRGVLFAMKVFTKIGDEARKSRFLQEVAVLQQFTHPAIMRVYDTGIVAKEHGGQAVAFPFLIADYLPQTLRDVMLSGSFPMAFRLAFCLQMLSGLSYLASRKPQIVHRDIKPENIFVKGRSFVLGDFGLIKSLSDDGDKEDPGFLIDSVGPRLPRFYRTPDLVDYCRGKETISTKSDVFQLGLVFAEVFTGVVPLKKCEKILDPVELEPLGAIAGSQEVSIRAQIERMLEPDVTRRYPAADLFDSWEGIFRAVVTAAHGLEGRVF